MTVSRRRCSQCPISWPLTSHGTRFMMTSTSTCGLGSITALKCWGWLSGHTGQSMCAFISLDTGTSKKAHACFKRNKRNKLMKTLRCSWPSLKIAKSSTLGTHSWSRCFLTHRAMFTTTPKLLRMCPIHRTTWSIGISLFWASMQPGLYGNQSNSTSTAITSLTKVYTSAAYSETSMPSFSGPSARRSWHLIGRTFGRFTRSTTSHGPAIPGKVVSMSH